jgi:hypothetical protein
MSSVSSENRPSPLIEQYYDIGNHFPTMEDLPSLRGIYKSLLSHMSQTIPANKLEFKGWLHYEHALALQSTFPDRARAQLDNTQDSLKASIEKINFNRSVPSSHSLRLKRAVALVGVLRIEHEESVTEVDSIGEISEVMKEVIYEGKRSRGESDKFGILSELAFAAAALVPASTIIRPLVATPRQENSPACLPSDSLSPAIDFNMFIPSDGDSLLHPAAIVPAQVKSQHLEIPQIYKDIMKLRPSSMHQYLPAIKMLYTDKMLGINNKFDEYQMFTKHLDTHVATGDITPYLQTAKENVVAALLDNQ